MPHLVKRSGQSSVRAPPSWEQERRLACLALSVSGPRSHRCCTGSTHLMRRRSWSRHCSSVRQGSWQLDWRRGVCCARIPQRHCETNRRCADLAHLLVSGSRCRTGRSSPSIFSSSLISPGLTRWTSKPAERGHAAPDVRAGVASESDQVQPWSRKPFTQTTSEFDSAHPRQGHVHDSAFRLEGFRQREGARAVLDDRDLVAPRAD